MIFKTHVMILTITMAIFCDSLSVLIYCSLRKGDELMKCYIPEHSGFCIGVALAVEAAYENINKSTYMFGEVVHNPSVISDLKNKGLKLVDSLDEIPEKCEASILIRAHGVSENIISEAKENGYIIIDKTCPRVKRVHDIAVDASSRGLDIIIVGTPNHPEVSGIVGWARTQTIVLRDVDDAKKTVPNTRFSEKGVCMVAQTTYNKAKYKEVYEYCSGVLSYVEFNDTICDATAIRQEEIRRLATMVDSVIVVGGKASSNVTKLYEIASEYNNNTHHIESAIELYTADFTQIDTVLIASGASTPEDSIREIIEYFRSFCLKNNREFEVVELKQCI